MANRWRPEEVEKARECLIEAAEYLALTNAGRGLGELPDPEGGAYLDPEHRHLLADMGQDRRRKIRDLALEVIEEAAWECDLGPEHRARLVEAIRLTTAPRDERDHLAEILRRPSRSTGS